MIEAPAYGDNKNPPDFVPTRPPYREDYWLLLNFKTDFSYISDGKMLEGKSGQYLIYKPYEPSTHTRSPSMKTGHHSLYLWFKGEDADVIMAASGLPTATPFNIPDTYLMQRCIQELFRKKYLTPICREYMESALVTKLLTELANEYHSIQNHSVQINRKIAETRSTMFKNYSEHWTIEKLAMLAGYSQSRFQQLYRFAYGQSPIDDLIRFRIHNAQTKIATGKLNITEIAAECGFSSVHYFSRCFKKVTGKTPSELIK